MSIKKSFAKAIGKVGLRLPAYSFDYDMIQAVDSDDAAAVKELLALDPKQLGTDYRQKAILGSGDAPTLLDYAIYHGHMQAAKAIAEADPTQLTRQNLNGQTLFMRQMRNPMSLNVVENLISLHQPQHFAMTDKQGNNLMHYAARAEQPHGVRALIEIVRGLINQPNNHDHTPLMEAARSGTPSVSEALLDGGAMLHVKNSSGNNATMIAIRFSNLDTAALLMDRGGIVDFSDPAVETQMRVATSEMNVNFLEALQRRREAQQPEITPAAKPAAPAAPTK